MRVTGDALRLWSLSLLALLIACGATVARAQEEQPEDGDAQCTAQLNPTVFEGESGACTALVTVAGERAEPVDGEAREMDEMEPDDGRADPYRAS